MKRSMTTITIIMSLYLLVSCGNNNQEFRNIEQIQERDGIPVRVEEINLQPFSISLTYNANLSGIKETVLSSMLSDRLERVYVSVGDYVEKDQLLISFPEDNPSAQYIQAKAAYENALQTYERMQSLFDEGGISQHELDQLQTAKQVSEANFKASEKMVKIKAPFDGYVSQINFRETESVVPGDPLATIVQIERYQTKIWVTENDIFSVSPGMRVIARWQDYELPGEVVQVSRSIDRNRQAFSVDLEFDNPNNFLLSGVMATIELFIYDNPSTIIVPRQFILSDRDGSFVYLTREGQAIKRYVEIGENDGIHFEIVSGLSVNDPLIKEGASQVTDNSRIRIVE